MTIKEVIDILSKMPNKNAEFFSIDDDGFVDTGNIMINEAKTEFVPYEIREYRKNHPKQKLKCPSCGSTHLKLSYEGNYGYVYQCENCDDSFTFDELE